MKHTKLYGLLLSYLFFVGCTPQQLIVDSRFKEQQTIEVVPLYEDIQAQRTRPVPTVDVSPGKYFPASFSIQLPGLSSVSFHTAFNIGSDVKKMKVYLVSNNSGALTTRYGPFSINDNLPACGGGPTTPCKLAGNFFGSRTVTFTNVPPGSFYVAAAAYSDIGATVNITNLASPGTIGGERYYVTDGGGETPTFPGRVTVGSDYVVTGAAQLTMNLKLLD